ncbi:MAG: hypothetical protein K1000chlam3_01417 [Chlamydiae bacterium]|nr:hypothetical protein [Chlamydiota bacterium]
MEEKIQGRDKEKELLKRIYHSQNPSFLVVYGRRRVGKTFLIKEFFQGRGVFFHLTGIKDAKTSAQLDHFSIEFRDTFSKGSKKVNPKDWMEAFDFLRREIEKTKGKVILFFDELPWLASPRSGFLQALDHLWNRYLSSMPNVILIICGSAASWMINKVINSRGGLHNRITHEIRLLPFTLQETKEYLEKKNIEFDLPQLAQLYFAIGGVAKYLTYISRGFSAAQIINILCFTKNGPLLREFHRLYDSLFSHSEHHIAIVKALAKVRSGLSYRDLAKGAKLSTGGTFTNRLRELQTSGFIDTISTFGKSKRDEKYILTDEYSLFYLTWMDNLSSVDLDDDVPNYWVKQQKSSRYETWKGLAFERLCMKHLKNIKQKLGVTSVITKTSKWNANHTEIDWLIDREDNCINLFEAKFVESEFVITKTYAEILRNKKYRFSEATQTKKTLFLTMITPYGVKENTHFLGNVDQQLTLTALI